MARSTAEKNQIPTRVATVRASALALLVLGFAAVPATAGPPVTVQVTDGTLRVSGGPSADEIALRLSAADPDKLQVDVGDNGSADFAVDLAQFRVIEVTGGNGADTIRIDQVNGAFTATETTRIGGGNGDDTLIGGSGAEVFTGGNGDDFVDGNGGVDTAFLGRGDDVFVWDPGDASDVVEGSRGSDTLIFNGSGAAETLAATAEGGRVLFTRNLGNIVMDLNEVEVIDVRALGGADAVTVNDVSGTDLDRVDVNLAATLGGSTADGLADVVSVAGTKGDDSIEVDAEGAVVEVAGLAAFVRISNTDPTLDALVVNTEAGADEVDVDPAVDGLVLVSVL